MTSVIANTRYAGTSDIDNTNGRTSGHGGVAQESAQVQNRKDGSTETPNTTVSTTINENTVQVTRPITAAEAGTRKKTYHS